MRQIPIFLNFFLIDASSETSRTPIQGLHCLPGYKDKYFKPRTQSVNDLVTDHNWLSVGPDLGPNCLQMLAVDKSRLGNFCTNYIPVAPWHQTLTTALVPNKIYLNLYICHILELWVIHKILQSVYALIYRFSLYLIVQWIALMNGFNCAINHKLLN